MKGNLESLSDEALAKMAREEDRFAFEVLCNRTLPVVFNRLRALLPPEAVEDVTQEVFIAAIKSIKHYQAKSSFRGWIAGIIRHKTADFYRKRGRRPETVSIDDDVGATVSDNPWQERAQVRIALQRLPTHYQETLLLRFAEGLSFQEVANALNISLEAAKSRYRRAVSAMAKEMGTDRN